MNKFMASLSVGLLAGMVAFRAGVPIWSDWIPGDAADFAMTSFWATWFLISVLKEKKS